MKKRIFLGFDGYVDRILKPIRPDSGDHRTYFQSAEEYLEYLGRFCRKSFSVELELSQERAGGNMPNVAAALNTMGFDVTAVGACGYPVLHPAFASLNRMCRLYSVSEPGLCDSIEFESEKMMLSIQTEINRMNGELLKERLPENLLPECLEDCDGAAFLNWGEMQCGSDIWQLLLEEILPVCSFTEKKPLLIDFSDFSRKSEDEVLRMEKMIRLFSAYFSVTVSVNAHELELFSGKADPDSSQEDLELLELKKRLHCEHLVLHLLDRAKYVQDETVYTAKKTVCCHPKLVTGGGDYFNAGLLSSLVLSRGLEQAVKYGNQAVNLFVENGGTEHIRKP